MLRLFLANLVYRLREHRARRRVDYMPYVWVQRFARTSHYDRHGGGDAR